ncbi:MAG: hypothetical protein K6A74_05560 [Lachnospiraceae bacterium]|nr:hypothetical protein [Lachnospiraceae bacterium]
MAKKKKDFYDDGRTVADMNIDGMPWYNPKKRESAANPVSELSPKEAFEVTKGVLAAALAVGAVFVVVFLLFILFCVFVWFR